MDQLLLNRHVFSNTAPKPSRPKWPLPSGEWTRRAWFRMKRGLAPAISNAKIDGWYEKAMTAGASGGKICGAGGGGFLLIVAKPECQQAVRHALQDLKEVPLSYETRGSQVMPPFIG
jgi:D-glycero-alpha-D-manno-heptose-7-phosphate kinase